MNTNQSAFTKIVKLPNGVQKKRERKRANKNIISNKARSKNYRERKKKYYTDLEGQVETLQEEIKKLKDENKLLKTRINTLQINQDDSSSSKLLQEQQYLFETLPKMYKEEPEKVTYSMLENVRDKYGPFGTERVKVLKHAFRTIIENVIPLDLKPLAVAFNVMDSTEVVRLIRHRKLQTNKFKF